MPASEDVPKSTSKTPQKLFLRPKPNWISLIHLPRSRDKRQRLPPRVGALDGEPQRRQVGTDVDCDALVGGGERVAVVGEELAVVDDVLAAQLHGQDAVLAEGPLLDHLQDGRLRDVGVHGEIVDARLHHHVVDEDAADVLALEVVDEG